MVIRYIVRHSLVPFLAFLLITPELFALQGDADKPKPKPKQEKVKAKHPANVKTQRITFPKGKSTASLKGTIDGRVIYTLHANSGQTIALHLAAQKGVGLGNITGPSGSLVTMKEKPKYGAIRDWTGTIDASGEYKITLNKVMAIDRALTYTLEVTVK